MEAKILGTPSGKIIKQILELGKETAFSLTGMGSIQEQVVQEDIEEKERENEK